MNSGTMFRRQVLCILARCSWQKISSTSLDDCRKMQMVSDGLLSQFPTNGWRCSHCPVSTQTAPRKKTTGRAAKNRQWNGRGETDVIYSERPGDKRSFTPLFRMTWKDVNLDNIKTRQWMVKFWRSDGENSDHTETQTFRMYRIDMWVFLDIILQRFGVVHHLNPFEIKVQNHFSGTLLGHWQWKEKLEILFQVSFSTSKGLIWIYPLSGKWGLVTIIQNERCDNLGRCFWKGKTQVLSNLLGHATTKIWVIRGWIWGTLNTKG